MLQHRCLSIPLLAAALRAAGIALLLALTSCSSSGIKTHPVSGKVEVKDGDTALLTGGHVELMQDTDETTRPSGKISSSGSFTVQTLHGGKILAGAPAGNYKVRIILGDESDEGVPKRKGDPINKKYYDFATSGLTVTVPGGDYYISLTKK